MCDFVAVAVAVDDHVAVAVAVAVAVNVADHVNVNDHDHDHVQRVLPEPVRPSSPEALGISQSPWYPSLG